MGNPERRNANPNKYVDHAGLTYVTNEKRRAELNRAAAIVTDFTVTTIGEHIYPKTYKVKIEGPDEMRQEFWEKANKLRK